MAISQNVNVLNILKRMYDKEGVKNLLFRNSPVLGMMAIERVVGREFASAALYGRGGACAGDYLVARTNAAATARNEEFKLTPGALWSALTINSKELAASATDEGAYMDVLDNKTFAAFEAFRKQMAKALYGTGFGEFDISTAADTLAVGPNTITLTEEGVIAIDIGTQFRFITPGADGSLGPSATVGVSVNTVTAIDGLNVTFTATNADTVSVGDVLCFEGSRDANDNPALPIGLGGIIPDVGNRTGTIWDNYIQLPFYGVNRSKAADRLAGQFVLSGANGSYKISDVVTELFRKCRRAGATTDLVIMNDRKYTEFQKELRDNSTFFQSVNGGDAGKTAATIGYNGQAFSLNTSFMPKIFDDPYCPYNKIYVIEQDKLVMKAYTDSKKLITDGVSGNEPGKPDTKNNSGTLDRKARQGLNFDDLYDTEQGAASFDGPTTVYALRMFGSFFLKNTANAGVAVLQ